MQSRDGQLDIRLVLIGGVIALLLASPWLWGGALTLVAGWNQAQATRGLDPVIAGLDRYQATAGHYPLVISEVAVDGTGLPRPPLGWRYGYTTRDGGRAYYLAMQPGGGDDRCYYYDGASRAWAVHRPDCPPGDNGPLYQRFP
jgi:hypothetical protein